MFNFLNGFIQEINLNLYKFEIFCDYLKIPAEIKKIAKELLTKQQDEFHQLKSRHKFLTYIASFFVSYVIINEDYNEFKVNINNLIQQFNNNRKFITRYVDLNKMLLIIRDKGYHQYLITKSLTSEQKEIYTTNIYKNELKNFLNKLDEEHNLSWYFKELEELIEPAIYLLKECFEPFEKFRSSRYSSACYYLLSKIKKLQRIKIPLDPFFRIIGKSKYNIIDHAKRIEDNLDYQAFIKKFPNFEFIEMDSVNY